MRILKTLVPVVVLGLSAAAFASEVQAGDMPHPKNNPVVFAAYPAWAFLWWAIELALHWVLLAGFPNRTARLTGLFEESPWKSLLLGLVNLFVILVILGVTLQYIPGLGLVLSVAAGVFLFIGIHGRSRALGRRILKAARRESDAFVEITVGFSAVAFLCAIPFVGWFILATYFCAGGLGALTLSFFKKRDAE